MISNARILKCIGNGRLVVRVEFDAADTQEVVGRLERAGFVVEETYKNRYKI